MIAGSITQYFNKGPLFVRRRLQHVLLLVFLVVCVVFIVRDPSVLAPLSGVTVIGMTQLCLAHVMLVIVNLLRYRLVLQKCSGQRIPLKPWIRLFVVGRFLNIFVPQLGNVWRSVELKREFSVSYTRYVTTLVALAWISTVLNLLLATVMIAVLRPSYQLFGAPAWGLLVSGLALICSAPFIGSRLVPLVGKRARRFQEVLEVSLELASDIKCLAQVLALSLLVFVGGSIALWCCFEMIDAPAQIIEVALFFVLLQTANIVRLTPGNVGPQEVAFAVFGAQSAVGAAPGMLASGLFRVGDILVLTVGSLALGVLDVLRSGATAEPPGSSKEIH